MKPSYSKLLESDQIRHALRAEYLEQRESPTQSTDPFEKLLLILQHGELFSRELRPALKLKHRPTFRVNYLHPALDAGFIERTIPEKPNSRLQKYRLTEKGKKHIESLKL
mgnify:CR=1 FL=1